jgi:hypothetical protein
MVLNRAFDLDPGQDLGASLLLTQVKDEPICSCHLS